MDKKRNNFIVFYLLITLSDIVKNFLILAPLFNPAFATDASINAKGQFDLFEGSKVLTVKEVFYLAKKPLTEARSDLRINPR